MLEPSQLNPASRARLTWGTQVKAVQILTTLVRPSRKIPAQTILLTQVEVARIRGRARR